VNLVSLKQNLLAAYHTYLESRVAKVIALQITHQEKAKLVNSIVWDYYRTLINSLGPFKEAKEHQQALLVLLYCTCVVSLEYRHKAWPYEYMALSRRVGELWERFCLGAWDYPSRPNVVTFEAPSFKEVETNIRSRIQGYISTSPNLDAILADIDVLFELVGEINMKEDKVFTVDNIPYVIDFKSGFGSNEKGNTLRLLTVGRTYKLWNPATTLLCLVRQEKNNNYLNVIRRSGLWEVRCGDEAYQTIDTLTGSDMATLRSTIIDFSSDLSVSFRSDLASHLTDLTSYLQW
jgi:hypothetical protein